MKNKFIYVLTIIITLFIGINGTFLYVNYINKDNSDIKEVNMNFVETNSISGAVNKIYEAVVLVENFKGNRLYATGTGFVYKKNDDIAYVMTNHHVIENATYVKLIMSDGEEIDAKVVGGDKYADIAVLSINPSKVKKVASLGDSSILNLGDTLFTVGSPLGREYQGTVTKGILSGKDRNVAVTLSNGDFLMEVLQTDAPINEGNSGGPLCDVNGNVIGVNSLKIVETSTEGMGFAIPIEIALATSTKLETGEVIRRPLLGISLVDIDNYILSSNSILLPSGINYGTVVLQIQKDSVAALAGLQKGDVILSIDDTLVKDTAYFRYLLFKYNIGDTIKIKINRDGTEQDLSITLSEALEG